MGTLVIHLRIRSIITQHHVVAETNITQIVDQRVQISLYDILHVSALMVEVAHTRPVTTCIVVLTQRHRRILFLALSIRSTTIVVPTDIGRRHLIGYTLVGLFGEIEPATDILSVIDNHIGNRTDTLVFESIDHGT